MRQVCRLPSVQNPVSVLRAALRSRTALGAALATLSPGRDTGRRMSKEHVELVHQAADAFNRRDLDAYLALANPAVNGRSLLVAVEGDYHSHRGVRRWGPGVL